MGKLNIIRLLKNISIFLICILVFIIWILPIIWLIYGSFLPSDAIAGLAAPHSPADRGRSPCRADRGRPRVCHSCWASAVLPCTEAVSQIQPRFRPVCGPPSRQP